MIAKYCVAIVKFGAAIGKQPKVQFQGQLSTCHFDPDPWIFWCSDVLGAAIVWWLLNIVQW